MEERDLLASAAVGALLFVAALAFLLAGAPGDVAGPVDGALHGVARALEYAGSRIVIGLVLLVAASWLAWRRRLLDAARVLVVPFVVEALVVGLKLVIARPRPEGAVADSFGFPSGHAADAAALALLLAFFATRRPAPSRRVAITLVGIGALWAVAQAIGRVLVGAHHASDVVGGAGFGLAIAGSALALSIRIEARATRRTTPP